MDFFEIFEFKERYNISIDKKRINLAIFILDDLLREALTYLDKKSNNYEEESIIKYNLQNFQQLCSNIIKWNIHVDLEYFKYDKRYINLQKLKKEGNDVFDNIILILYENKNYKKNVDTSLLYQKKDYFNLIFESDLSDR